MTLTTSTPLLSHSFFHTSLSMRFIQNFMNDEDMDDDIGEQLDENRWFCWHGCEGLISLHEQVCG